MRMRSPQRKQSLFAVAINASDSVQIDLNRFMSRAKLRDRFGQTFCPFSDELATRNNLDSVAEVEDRGL